MLRFSGLVSDLVAVLMGLVAAGYETPAGLAQEATPTAASVVLPVEAEVDGVDLAAWERTLLAVVLQLSPGRQPGLRCNGRPHTKGALQTRPRPRRPERRLTSCYCGSMSLFRLAVRASWPGVLPKLAEWQDRHSGSPAAVAAATSPETRRSRLAIRLHAGP